MLFVALVGVSLTYDIQSVGHIVFDAGIGESYDFRISNSSLSVEFTFATEDPASITIGANNTPLTKPFFLLEGTNSVKLSFAQETRAALWAFPESLCDGHVSVFGSNEESRFRAKFSNYQTKWCIFPLNSGPSGAFIMFQRPSPELSNVLFAYDSNSLSHNRSLAETRWESDEIDFTELVFFGINSTMDTEWALNIEFSEYENPLRNTCIFDDSPVYDGGFMNETNVYDVEYISMCGYDTSVVMDLVIYAILFVITLPGSAAACYWCYQSWQHEGVYDVSAEVSLTSWASPPSVKSVE